VALEVRLRGQAASSHPPEREHDQAVAGRQDDHQPHYRFGRCVPELVYADVAQAIDWLCDTFVFTEIWRAGLVIDLRASGPLAMRSISTAIERRHRGRPGRTAAAVKSGRLSRAVDDRGTVWRFGGPASRVCTLRRQARPFCASAVMMMWVRIARP
jgi:hypothetical protein